MDIALEVTITLPLFSLHLQQVGSFCWNQSFPLLSLLVESREICIGPHIEHIIAILNANDCCVWLRLCGCEDQRSDWRILAADYDENKPK